MLRWTFCWDSHKTKRRFGRNRHNTADETEKSSNQFCRGFAGDSGVPHRSHMLLMRALYSAAWWAALPLVLVRLWWRGRKEPGYRQHWVERLGFYRGTSGDGRGPLTVGNAPLIWVHAVSVGETRAAEPLIDALLAG